MDSLFPTPAAGFDHPLEMLDACHERILRNCALIERIAARLATHGSDSEARAAAAGVLRYFETAAAEHHRDEEEQIFPALRHWAPSSELNAVFDLLLRLKADHNRLGILWSDMRVRLAALADGGECRIGAELAARFKGAYERHIALERAQLIPLARRVLDQPVLRVIGERMARRRGVAAP